MRALTLARILEARQGDGTYVTSLEPSMLLEPLTFMADFHQDRTLLHVLEVRRILEAAVAALAAQYITDEELAELRSVVDEMDACETVEAFVANDLRFHRIIGAASRNPVLASVLDSFSTPMSRARVWRGVTQANAIDADEGPARRALRRAGASPPGRRPGGGDGAHRRGRGVARGRSRARPRSDASRNIGSIA